MVVPRRQPRIRPGRRVGAQVSVPTEASLIAKNVLVELLEQRLPTDTIAKRLGCSPGNVLYWERKYGLRPAFASFGSGRRTRSPKEMAAYMISSPTLRRRKLKARAIAHKGGKCLLCGYNRCNAALELHHLDKTTKAFGLSRRGVIRSWDSIKTELDKRVLISANRHRSRGGSSKHP